MPKLIEYPRGSFAKSLELANAVNSLGGKCTTEMAATKLGRTVSGAFKAVVNAAMKYGLVDSNRGKLSITELYRDYKLAYSDDDKRAALRKALLTPGCYESLYNRFLGEKLPGDILDKLLIREFDVRESDASRVAGYFIDGAKELGLLGEDGVLSGQADSGEDEGEGENEDEDGSEDDGEVELPSTAAKYVVSIRGPGMKSEIQLLEPDDLLIVDAMLTKVRKKLEAMEAEAE